MEIGSQEFEGLAMEDKANFKLKPPPKSVQVPEALENAETLESVHNKLIIMQAMNYKNQGYTDIKVNHTHLRERQPDPVEGFTPDLTAVLNDKTTICEVETNESVYDFSSVEKWKAFDNSGYQFHLIIPAQAFNGVKEIMKNNGISIDKYWCIKNY